MKKIFVSLFCLSILFSCQPQQSKDAVYQDPIGFERFFVDSIYFLPQRPNLELQIFIYYPVNYADAAVLDSLQRLMTASATQGADFEYDYQNPARFVQQFADYQAGIFSRYELPDVDAGMLHPSAYTSDTDIVLNHNGILCFVTSIFHYAGGAHGYYGEFFTNVDLKTGRKLAIKDIFSQSGEETLTATIREMIADDLSNYNLVSEIKPTNNFYFDFEDEGVVFVYNPYEIAPHSSGIIDIYIPFDEIVPLLLPDTPIKRLLGL